MKKLIIFLIILYSNVPVVIALEDFEVDSVTQAVWQEAVISVTNLDRSAKFFIDIGGYEIKWRGPLSANNISQWGLPDQASGEALLLGPSTYRDSFVRLVRFDAAGKRIPMRPGSRAWDTGCYFSLMVRMKDISSIYDDAIKMGWWTETPIVDLEFGISKLKVTIFRGPDGVQVQGYERLSPPLPETIPDFKRFAGPFNVMQIVKDRDKSYEFFTQVLGFETFYKGKPYTAKTPTHTPLGIPINLTTSVPYQAGIVYPRAGEFGRMEMIEMMGLVGRDYSHQCHAPNLGILSVRYPVESAEQAKILIQDRGWQITNDIQILSLPPYGNVKTFSVTTPDGSIIEFIEMI